MMRLHDQCHATREIENHRGVGIDAEGHRDFLVAPVIHICIKRARFLSFCQGRSPH